MKKPEKRKQTIRLCITTPKTKMGLQSEGKGIKGREYVRKRQRIHGSACGTRGTRRINEEGMAPLSAVLAIN